ncbi:MULTISPECIES: endonuclease/exonuclease/phosphatase family protein [Streptomyces]|uniref:Metal-dependent hydrolase, endonuclease/exonuclease/phosphatase family n=1 Tax=Streptomyces aidingensis TaxID=910347 RepID=A0A1I1TPP2_9ACTN|nr:MULTISPECIES: endonuclease/exonuclease/phosphatase family protein [Streptomyces]SFD60345.1 Metal-dependent hydrolase, endonuclease/exonuclease/phosphatase family [Streptomyces aidingensis]
MSTTVVRAASWNLYVGGIDGGDETRRKQQISVLADEITQTYGEPDIVTLTEMTHWDAGGWWRLQELAEALRMAWLTPVTSRVSSDVGTSPNHLAILYRPERVNVLRYQAPVGNGAFHHGLARAHLAIDGVEFAVLATHLAWTDGDTRLREARWMTDNAGPFPGQPRNALLMGDLNVLAEQDPEPDWNLIPRNTWSRYRQIHADGSWGPADRRALRVLLNSGWIDPQTVVRQARKPTVGHYPTDSAQPSRIDHALVTGEVRPKVYATHASELADSASDHRPIVLTAEIGAAA